MGWCKPKVTVDLHTRGFTIGDIRDNLLDVMVEKKFILTITHNRIGKDLYVFANNDDVLDVEILNSNRICTQIHIETLKLGRAEIQLQTWGGCIKFRIHIQVYEGEADQFNIIVADAELK